MTGSEGSLSFGNQPFFIFSVIDMSIEIFRSIFLNNRVFSFQNVIDDFEQVLQ